MVPESCPIVHLGFLHFPTLRTRWSFPCEVLPRIRAMSTKFYLKSYFITNWRSQASRELPAFRKLEFFSYKYPRQRGSPVPRRQGGPCHGADTTAIQEGVCICGPLLCFHFLCSLLLSARGGFMWLAWDVCCPSILGKCICPASVVQLFYELEM